MKKVLSLALCGLTVFAVGAQKTNVDQAKKLAGKPEKITEARALINDAIQNPETSGQADTYYVAGKIEWDAFNKQRSAQAVNPDKVDPMEMGQELLNGFDYFMQVFPREKGEAKPKYTKELQKKIAEKTNDFFDAGALFYNAQQYPQAYRSFMIFGDMPELVELGEMAPQIPDTIRATSYFNAGISAWTANEVDNAALAFRKARENNYNDPNACIYEIACWQDIQMKDSTRLDEAKNAIYSAAEAGYKQFGISQPVFINNMANSMLNSDREQDALALVNNAIAQYPNSAALYGLRGFINDRMGNEQASEADYLQAVSYPDVDIETLKNASKKLLHIGQTRWNDIAVGDSNAAQKKAEIKNKYFNTSKSILERIKQQNPQDSDVDYLLDSVNYLIELN